jgi:hypothetical protein
MSGAIIAKFCDGGLLGSIGGSPTIGIGGTVTKVGSPGGL